MIEVQSRVLDYVGGGMLVFVSLVFLYGMIFVCDIPCQIAKKREHPHQDAICVAGWVSLLSLHVIWPFLWIWAMMHKPDLPGDEDLEKQAPNAVPAGKAPGGEA
ncbi:DUF3302 domain-containing protein [Pseudodesulfovibrio sp.]|uniref:DUF3302 domain-containing protein n=1 Tax=Pseudodesulfovibrio sp. TaxID=2035812 RepID=UPI0026198624|nr:DUF3302 domain-containing protein [Pseudodesulfovibrio sp.]MDD3311370.1 DUF3302 domain-containing protein [Pseudodesulfovibrio sp.]